MKEFLSHPVFWFQETVRWYRREILRDAGIALGLVSAIAYLT